MEVLVEYDYVAQNPDELTIKKGERIRNVQRKEEGWYEGELVNNGRRGVFPDNFVKAIKTPNVITQKMGFQKQQVKSPENTKKNNTINHIGFKVVDNVHQNGSAKNNQQQQQQQQPPPTASPPPPPPPSTINQVNSNNLNNINNKSNPPLPIRKPLKRKS
jgi:hypothetical protein